MLSPDNGGKGNKVLAHATPWMNLENARLRERTHKRSHVAKMSRIGKSRDRQYISACLRLRCEMRVSFLVIKMFKTNYTNDCSTL